MSTYSEKLKHPKWQRKRLEILERDKFQCKLCGDKETTLHVHHLSYIKGKSPWEYEDSNFETLCSDCHEAITAINTGKNIPFSEFRAFKYKEEDYGSHLFISFENKMFCATLDCSGKYMSIAGLGKERLLKIQELINHALK